MIANRQKFTMVSYMYNIFNTVCFIAGCLELSVHGGQLARACKEVTLNNFFIVRQVSKQCLVS